MMAEFLKMGHTTVVSKITTGPEGILVERDIEGGAKEVNPFLAENHYTMPVLLDPKAEVFTKYGLVGTPGTFIADRQGMLVASSFGPVDFDRPEFRKYILDLAEDNNTRG